MALRFTKRASLYSKGAGVVIKHACSERKAYARTRPQKERGSRAGFPDIFRHVFFINQDSDFHIRKFEENEKGKHVRRSPAVLLIGMPKASHSLSHGDLSPVSPCQIYYDRRDAWHSLQVRPPDTPSAVRLPRSLR